MNTLTALSVSFILGVFPMVIFAIIVSKFDRFEKEPLWLMISIFLWGMIISSMFAILFNSIFQGIGYMLTGKEQLASDATAVFSAPLVEEFIKGLGLLGIFVFFNREIDSILDGIIYGSLVGMGFAATENFIYIFSAFQEMGAMGLAISAIARLFLVPFLHAFMTSFTGIGLAYLKLKNNAIIPILLFCSAVAIHFMHNLFSVLRIPFIMLFSITFEWMGVAGMLGFVVYLIIRERKVMRDALYDEIAIGTISEGDYNIAASLGGQISARLANPRCGKLYNLMGKLAFRKYQKSPETEIESIRDMIRKEKSTYP